MYDKFKNDADLININDLDNHLPDVDILIGCLPRMMKQGNYLTIIESTY